MSIRIENNLNLGELRRRIAELTPDALEAGAEHVKAVAVEKAPLLVDLERANQDRRADPGELRESAYVHVIDDVTAEVGFSAFYAGWQHERMDYHHEVGQAKFLEEPLVTEKDETLQIMAGKIREGL